MKILLRLRFSLLRTEMLLAERRGSELLPRSRSVPNFVNYSYLKFVFRLRYVQDGKAFMPYIVYILECSDGSYYTGSTVDINKRLWHHQQGVERSSYTFARRPVKLVWTSEEVEHYYDALRWERQIKGWSRAKKEALIHGDFEAIHEIVKTERKEREKKKKSYLR